MARLSKELTELLENLKQFDEAICSLSNVMPARGALGREASKAIRQLTNDVEIAIADWNADHADQRIVACDRINIVLTCDRYTINEVLCDSCQHDANNEPERTREDCGFAYEDR